MKTLIDDLVAYRDGSQDKRRMYEKDCVEMARRFANAVRKGLGIEDKDDPRFHVLVGEMKNGMVEVRTTVHLGEYEFEGEKGEHSFPHVWQVYLERGEWCVKSAFWSNTKDLGEVGFDTTVAAAIKDIGENVRQGLDKAYHDARWATKYGRA